MVKNNNILVVDDEPSIRRLLSDGLSAEGFEVEEAKDGDEAVRAVEKSPPDLVLLDILMPKMNGFETCRRIREWSHVPIIMLSALSDPMDKVRSLDLGADDYLVKPFGINELLARIKAVLQRSNAGE